MWWPQSPAEQIPRPHANLPDESSVNAVRPRNGVSPHKLVRIRARLQPCRKTHWNKFPRAAGRDPRSARFSRAGVGGPRAAKRSAPVKIPCNPCHLERRRNERRERGQVERSLHSFHCKNCFREFSQQPPTLRRAIPNRSTLVLFRSCSICAGEESAPQVHPKESRFLSKHVPPLPSVLVAVSRLNWHKAT
jgi:hypothetical protein